MGFVLKHKRLSYSGDLEAVDPPRILPVRAFPANTANSPNVGLMLANVADVSLTLKQHWVNVSSLEYYLVISTVTDNNAVNMYCIGYCSPTLDHPTHAYLAAVWIFKCQIQMPWQFQSMLR